MDGHQASQGLGPSSEDGTNLTRLYPTGMRPWLLTPQSARLNSGPWVWMCLQEAEHLPRRLTSCVSLPRKYGREVSIGEAILGENFENKEATQ